MTYMMLTKVMELSYLERVDMQKCYQQSGKTGADLCRFQVLDSRQPNLRRISGETAWAGAINPALIEWVQW